ncbi:MAG TPA: hypothetical protein VHG08_16510 [Longimicrobium sp.]|nr:hypothetical protein [Longimicrobium sp.]
MDDQTTMTADPNNAPAPAAGTVPPGHRKVEGSDYDITFHPAFASACTVQNKGETVARDLYRQGNRPEDVVHCPEGHPKKHVIRLKGKNGNQRDITITIDDPSHSLHRISLALYDPARSPLSKQSYDATETFTLENDAKTCPPYCDPEGEE